MACAFPAGLQFAARPHFRRAGILYCLGVRKLKNCAMSLPPL
jgi:hypothetical protein